VRDARSVLLGGCWIFDGENATAKQILRGRIVAIINGANLYGAKIGKGVSLPKGWKRSESGIIVKDET
jgi:hypothetical protein